MLDDIGASRMGSIAKHLGVSIRTVQRWRKDDSAPRSALLAVFWETSYGRATINIQAENDARMFAGYAKCLSEAAGLRLPPMHREAANSCVCRPAKLRAWLRWC